MKILMLNVWGGVLHHDLLPFLREQDADIYCLQEVVHTPATTAEWLHYRDAERDLPQRTNLLTEIGAVLPGHAATYCPFARGHLFDDGTPVPSFSGLATFVKRDLTVIGQLHDFVHDDFLPDRYGEHPYPRQAHVVRVYDDRLGAAITVAHMHGLRDLIDKADTPARRAQAERLVRMIKVLHRPDERLVVCGDFNILPGSETLAILGELGLTELVTTRGFDGTRTPRYKKPQRFADYMLVNDAVRIETFDVMTTPEVSDHAALVLEIDAGVPRLPC